ncbi:unnamed protein product [Eruca vesicaria subsp. sativa]|uniref:Secreted protein n=1 Tax=Eruca vesicaria subsp. sativa TaxID=29727 RepID=A0ABC8LUI5_ERUVS|nr:unnamed protein product [Eruca vesicaria subsp. sativa]
MRTGAVGVSSRPSWFALCLPSLLSQPAICLELWSGDDAFLFHHGLVFRCGSGFYFVSRSVIALQVACGHVRRWSRGFRFPCGLVRVGMVQRCPMSSMAVPFWCLRLSSGGYPGGVLETEPGSLSQDQVDVMPLISRLVQRRCNIGSVFKSLAVHSFLSPNGFQRL